MIEEPPLTRGQNSDGLNNRGMVPSANKSAPLLKIKVALKTRTVRKNKIISFKEAKRVMSWYQISKKECFKLLEELKEEGFLEISRYHGVKIKEKR
jgi:hypothetical protein